MKRLLVAVLGLVAFATGYGVTAEAYPGGGVFGRAQFHGFFTNANDSSGWEVLNVSCASTGEYGPYNYNNGSSWCNAIPQNLDTAGELIAFIQGRINNGVPNGSHGFGSGTYGDPRAKTGAALIVHTMLGTPDGQRSRPPTPAQMNDWIGLVNAYASAGKISWNTSAFTYNLNSLYQGTDNSPSPDDDAFYDATRADAAIVFLDAANGVEYAIRRACGNPVGQGNITQLSNFNMSGSTTVNGSSSDISVVPGATLTFSHSLSNSSADGITTSTSINWTARNTVSSAVTGSGSAGTFTAGQTKVVWSNETVTVPAGTASGTQFCRRVEWSPDTQNGGSGNGATRCATVVLDYNLNPSITNVPAQAESGDTVPFTYTINNTGSTPSSAATCYVRDGSGTLVTGLTLSCASPGQVFNTSPPIYTVGTENLLITPAMEGTQVCRQLFIEPATPSVASRSSTLTCVRIVNKPYTRVYGGDISAGNGLNSGSGTCSANPQGAVVGWNRRTASSPSYAGAGAQFAIMALYQIQDFTTALGNSGGAPKPQGLSFANTNSNSATGDFGGDFGSLPCIPNHWGTKPTSGTLPIPANVGLMNNGTYANAVAGPVTLGGGALTSPERISVFVDGNLYITSNITYSGTWSVTGMPTMRIIVRGNIYIDNDVSQLDGLYVAQADGGSGGIIYTCTTSAAPLAPSTASFYNDCDNQKLTVNGALVASELQLGRTRGTLSQASASESAASGFAGEVFNFSPSLWMQQPTDTSSASDYDSIVSLPPIL